MPSGAAAAGETRGHSAAREGRDSRPFDSLNSTSSTTAERQFAPFAPPKNVPKRPRRVRAANANRRNVDVGHTLLRPNESVSKFPSAHFRDRPFGQPSRADTPRRELGQIIEELVEDML